MRLALELDLGAQEPVVALLEEIVSELSDRWSDAGGTPRDTRDVRS